MICYTEHDSPLGKLTLVASEFGMRGIYFEQHMHFKGNDGWQHDAANDNPHLKQAAHQLDEYFAGRRTSFDVALDVIGTDFQRAVWHELSKIPFGTTASYGQQALRIGQPKAVRAVGAANGRNPVSIIVPCHRVIGASGAATGYAGGLERKRYLLALEGVDLA